MSDRQSYQQLVQCLHDIYSIYLDEVLGLKNKPVKAEVASRLQAIKVYDRSEYGELVGITIIQNYAGKNTEYHINVLSFDGNRVGLELTSELPPRARKEVENLSLGCITSIMGISEDVVSAVFNRKTMQIAVTFNDGEIKEYKI